MEKDVLNFIIKKEELKLSEILKGLKKVIETEGDLSVQQVIISKNSFNIQQNNKFYEVENYDKYID